MIAEIGFPELPTVVYNRRHKKRIHSLKLSERRATLGMEVIKGKSDI